MADSSFPQIPASVWWGVRDLLKKSPSATIDQAMLSAKLSVQPAAARQYLAELKRIGILSEEGRATDVAGRWRIDDTYRDAVSEIVSGAYPEGLVTIAPPEDADRTVVRNWFMSQGLGEGSAGNKTATYLIVSSPEPSDSAQKTKKESSSRVEKHAQRKNTASEGGSISTSYISENTTSDAAVMPLNVNVQIHISADASNEQIESIFRSMRDYLRN